MCKITMGESMNSTEQHKRTFELEILIKSYIWQYLVPQGQIPDFNIVIQLYHNSIIGK